MTDSMRRFRTCEIAVLLVDHDQFKMIPLSERRHLAVIDTRGIWQDMLALGGAPVRRVSMHFIDLFTRFLLFLRILLHASCWRGLFCCCLPFALGSACFVSGAVALCVSRAVPRSGMSFLTPLEQRFPEQSFPDRGIDGIIVLGGSYDSVSHGYLSTIVLEEDTEPMAVMVDLARRYPRLGSFFPAARTRLGVPGPSEAAIVKQYFVSFGIAADRISIEERSLDHRRERPVHRRFDQAGTPVTLAAGDVLLSHASGDGDLPKGRL